MSLPGHACSSFDGDLDGACPVLLGGTHRVPSLWTDVVAIITSVTSGEQVVMASAVWLSQVLLGAGIFWIRCSAWQLMGLRLLNSVHLLK